MVDNYKETVILCNLVQCNIDNIVRKILNYNNTFREDFLFRSPSASPLLPSPPPHLSHPFSPPLYLMLILIGHTIRQEQSL
jgi:hypothetical protein